MTISKSLNETGNKYNIRAQQICLFTSSHLMIQEVEKKKREISSSGFLGNSIKSTNDDSSSSSTYDQNSTVFVELGAGKGLLGLAVSCIKVRQNHILLCSSFFCLF